MMIYEFGQCWEALSQPIRAFVGAIDSDGYNSELYRVGLSAMQLCNLGIERLSPPLNKESLMRVIKSNQKGLLDGQMYDDVCLEYMGRSVNAQVYNAFGERGFRGNRIRVSSMLAEELKLSLFDKVLLRK